MNALASSSQASPNDKPLSRPQSPRLTGTASRFFISMGKSISHSLLTSPRKRHADNSRGGIGMYSTPEERNPYVQSRMHARYRESSASRPTIEQIAMGLHLSCTPHLRNPCHQSHSAPSSPSHIRYPHDSSALHRPTHSLPPPPSRSSLKKTSTSNGPRPNSIALLGESPSTSTITSTGPATPDGARSVLSLKHRMSKLILGYRSAPSSARIISAASSGTGSEGTRPTTPRKSVRFSTSVLALEN
ncbi:uncharacterized protein EDB91DRAFT_1219620 [Suillus paluster]|uniref:uncharacterized protein n=1 Tax=Suillus paluster TaxID=48578 RepID=UPI001B87C277|nr:uncharacterized protein EDB91DRAFT_1219620 [Suillus paluster]KAG1746608.1 hypothetical protein EDB91DRAFT_1219620 [Suillus paluster]